MHSSLWALVLFGAALLMAGGAGAGEIDRNLGSIAPFEDRAGLAKALASAVSDEAICLGVAKQGNNVELSRNRRTAEPQTGIIFPTLVDSTTPGRLRIELESLTHAGLIELATVEGFETYRLTERGHQAYDLGRRDFCLRGVELAGIVEVSDRRPEADGGVRGAALQLAELAGDGGNEAQHESQRQAYVVYRYRVVAPTGWARNAGLKRIYPVLKNLDGGTAVALIRESKDGWSLVETVPVAG
ncbi:MAG: hypothetical protein HYR63_25270 [Proteobacteria bacterium]|nr:hypothetical protein [Pseudomonadota bacterium]MBI3497241.1 hypothetical protein [Pseudomonadota bacterium]